MKVNRGRKYKDPAFIVQTLAYQTLEHEDSFELVLTDIQAMDMIASLAHAAKKFPRDKPTKKISITVSGKWKSYRKVKRVHQAS